MLQVRLPLASRPKLNGYRTVGNATAESRSAPRHSPAPLPRLSVLISDHNLLPVLFGADPAELSSRSQLIEIELTPGFPAFLSRRPA